MARRNLDPNSHAANGLTGRISQGGTQSHVTNLVAPYVRSTGSRMTTGTANSVLQGAQHNPSGSLAGRRFSTWIQWGFDRVPGDGAGPFVMAFDSANAYIGNVAAEVRRTSGIGEAVLIGTAPANTTRVAGALYSGSTAVASLMMTLGAIRIEEVDDPNIVYRAGDDPGWQYDGAAGASTSTMTHDEGAEWWALLGAGVGF